MSHAVSAADQAGGVATRPRREELRLGLSGDAGMSHERTIERHGQLPGFSKESIDERWPDVVEASWPRAAQGPTLRAVRTRALLVLGPLEVHSLEVVLERVVRLGVGQRLQIDHDVGVQRAGGRRYDRWSCGDQIPRCEAAAR